MSRRTSSVVRIVLLSTALLGAGVASAQTNLEVNAGIQFNFSVPGARSLGMGGAFVGLADDATAAYTNPAGLTILTTQEISAEGRSWDYTTVFSDAGVASFSTPDLAGLVEGEASSDTSGLSFVSYVYPGKRWAFALYRHEMANFGVEIESQGPAADTDGNGSADYRRFPVRGALDLKIQNLGLSGAVRFSDRFSLGVGVSQYSFSLGSRNERYAISEFEGPPDFSPNNIWTVQSLDESSEDDDVGLIVGFKWQLGGSWSLGGVYRQGPEFELTARNTIGPALAALAPDLFTEGDFWQTDGKFRVPDVYGVGLAYQSGTGAVRLALDWVRVEYSSLTGEVTDAFVSDTPSPEREAALRDLTVDDADELHLGLEYVFIKMRSPFYLRAGVWLDPDHQARYDGPLSAASSLEALERQNLALTFREGDDEVHLSGGFGWSFADGRFELNAGADFSDRVETGSVSAVVRF